MAIDYAALNALTTDWGRETADLDLNQNRLRINYNSVLDRMRRNLDKNKTSLSESMADRGMTHSGPALKSDMNMQEEFNLAGAEAAERQNMELAGIARRRILANNALESGRLTMMIPEPLEPKE